MQLNEAQRAAVQHLHGPLLVVAGAGTGKTRVITQRICYLLETIPALEGENILAITFTVKAAAEMRARIRRGADHRAARVGVHTFHDFCYDLLRQHDPELRILDDVDTWIFLRRRLDRLGLNLFQKLSEPGRFLSDFRDFFSRCQDELVSPSDYAWHVKKLATRLKEEEKLLAEGERRRRADQLAQQQEIARVYAAAEELLREAKRLTFGGTLFHAVQLLATKPEVLAHHQERLRYILVDEFQDTNIAQIELLRLLADRHRNLMAVGDDDQAIYRWRGASYASFAKFAELFPDGRRIVLTQNYRSTARILKVAGILIAQNGKARFDPEKKLLPQRPKGEKVGLLEVHDAALEAAAVRREIEHWQRERGRYAGLAVLYRKHVHRNALVEELNRAGIPFVIRKLSILSHPLIRDLLAYLRVILYPGDNIRLARVLASPRWGLTRAMLLDLFQRARREQGTLANAIESLHPQVRDEKTNLGALLDLLAELRQQAEELPVTQLFDRLIERLSLELLPSDPDRVPLNTLAAFVRTWEEEKSESKRLREFLDYLDYFDEASGAICAPEADEGRDAVQLMTVHTAKGLEFDSVFVLRLNAGDFPPYRRRPLFEFPAELMKEATPPGDFRTQEERRLCYVAMTRAQNRLLLSTLTGPRKNPSPFLEDVLREPLAVEAIKRGTPSRTALEARPGGSAPRPADKTQGLLFSPAAARTRCSRIAQWAESHALDQAAEPLRLSHSAIETYRLCPLKYKLRYLWRLRAPANAAMVFGQIMHRTVVDYFRARPHQLARPLEELRHIYQQAWRQAEGAWHDEYQRQQYFRRGWEQAAAFHEQQAEQPTKVLELEKSFEWRWDDVVLLGRIDQINRLRGGGAEIIEYKTGEPPKPEKVEKSLQLALYAEAAKHEFGLRPQRLTLYNFTLNKPLSFSPTEDAAQRALEKVREVAALIRARAFNARAGYACRNCEYRPLCPEHEQPLPLGGITAASEDNKEGSQKKNERGAATPGSP